MRKKRRKRVRAVRTVVLSSALLFAAGAGGYAYLAESGTAPERMPVFPSLYSDARITVNAKLSDPRFRDTVAIEGESGVANILSVFKRWRYRSTPPPPPDMTPERGSWLWTPIPEITPAYRAEIIAGAKQNGITEIYLSIDSYLDIFVLPESEEKQRRKDAFDRIVVDFIRHADAAGIAVDAEAGWRNWAEPGHEYKAKAVIDYAIEFNRTNDLKFRGFQYDVEPYLLEEYRDKPERVLRRFTALIDQSVEWLYGSDLRFTVVIPEFYDGSYGDAGRYFFGLGFGHTIDHLIGILEMRPGSQIIVMAYRNYAEGTDGSIDITRREMDAAEGSDTSIIVAQETGDFPPPYITFHNTSRERFERQLGFIESAFSSSESYGGLAIHYINALMALR